MSLIIENISGAELDINDLGITLGIGETTDITIRVDARTIARSATGGDLDSLITANSLDVHDPIDGTTILSNTDALFLLRSFNDPHYRLTSHRDIDGDTQIWVDDGSVDDDIIRFDVGDAPAGYGAVTDIFTIGSSGWTVNLGTATGSTTIGAGIDIDAGTGGATAAGGDVRIDAGQGGATSGDGGRLILVAGNAQTDGVGGDARIKAGNSFGIGNTGGIVQIDAGNGDAGEDGGYVHIGAGFGGAGADSGYVEFTFGPSSNDNNSHVRITQPGDDTNYWTLGFDDTTALPCIGRSSTSGGMKLFPDATVCQWIFGSNAAGTTDLFIDCDNNGTMHLNGLHTGPVRIGEGGLQIEESGGGGNMIGLLAAPVMTADYDLTFPAGAPSANQVLESDGSGNFSWVNSSSLGAIDRLQAVFVNKHGNDSNSGLSPELAKLTFGAAITTVNAATPSTTNRFAIVCDDAGIYAESFTVPSWTQVVAESAKIEGTVTLSDDSEAIIREVEAAVNTSAVVKSSGSGSSRIIAEILRTTGTGDTVSNGASVTGVLIVQARQIFVENGTGVIDNSTGATGHVHVEVEDLYITGAGSAIDSNTTNGLVVGRAAHILEIGGGIGNGTGFTVSTGRVDMTCGFIDADTAYNVSGNGRLRIIVNELGGTRTQTAGGAVVDILEANSLRWITIDNTDSPYVPRRIEFLNVDTTAGAIEIDLDGDASDGDVIWFQDAQGTFSTNNLTIDANGNTIAGAATLVVSVDGQSGFAVFQAATSNWSVTFTSEAAFSPDNVIYVTKNGNDTTGDGSFSNPFLTVKKGVTEALLVASSSNPTTVKVLDGVYDEDNPINVTGTNSEFVNVQGSSEQSTIVRPDNNGFALFNLTSNTTSSGPQLDRLFLQGKNNGGTDYEDVIGGDLVNTSGDGRFFLTKINFQDGHTGINAGNGVISTNHETTWSFGSSISNTVGIDMKGGSLARSVNQVAFLSQNDTHVTVAGGGKVELGNFEISGGNTGTLGTGIVATGTSEVFGNNGFIHNLITAVQGEDTSITRILSTNFQDNTTDLNQVDGTATLRINGRLSKTKQLIADGANVSLNYTDSDTGDFIVGNAESTGTPGQEFRVRNADGRIAIGNNATDANIASGGVGGSRTVNLIDENGNLRIWRFVTVDGQDPAVEWIKGINTANPDDVGDAPITAITAGTDTITIDVSGTDYNDPFDPTPGIDRTTLAERAFPAGREIRVNGTASNNGDFTVSSATYNSGPETIDIVVTTDITVSEGAGGEVVFGGGAGRDDGVSTYVGDPGSSVAAGAGNVWWDMFLQEDDYFVIRHRTGGSGAITNEKVRIYPDRSEWLGALDYGDGDNEFIAIMQAVTSAVNYTTINNAATGSGPEIVATGSDTDIDIEMIPKGTGTVTVPTGYEANIVDESLVNKAYLDVSSVTKFQFPARLLESPTNADWAVNSLAPASPDSNNAGVFVRLFDDTTDEGVGFSLRIPAGATNMTIGFVSRAETAPGGAVTANLDLYRRSFPDNAAPTAWSGALALTAIDLPTNENWQYDEQTITLATLGLTAGDEVQFELVRNGGTLTGDWTLKSIDVSFS